MKQATGQVHAALVFAATAALLCAATPGFAAARAQAAAPTIHVSASTGTDSSTCGTLAAPCRTIGQAITNAAAGSTVLVGAGSYHELVVLPKPLILDGAGATIDATGLSTGSGQTLDAAGVLVLPSASGATIKDLTVHGAYGEGILVMGASHVTVTHNVVSGNDLGTPKTTKYLECQPQGQVPGDCGEGIHLMSASASQVLGNLVSGNSGGILVSDELGPASGNRIAQNTVVNNLYDCGITLPSHNPHAMGPGGMPQPAKGGVFNNVVEQNVVVGNGTKGDGAGILIAAAGPGMASYNNRVLDNVVSGNGMAGVTLHAHAPNQDISGNVIEGNVIGMNNLTGDPDAKVKGTTGIVIFSVVVPVSVTVRDNRIMGNATAIWTSAKVTMS
jgi:parallel beta-helix repeat protein